MGISLNLGFSYIYNSIQRTNTRCSDRQDLCNMRNSIKYTIPILLSFLINFNVNAQDLEISNGEVFDGEPYLAINPSNSEHIIIAWMGHVLLNKLSIKSKVSFDGGATWSVESVIPHEFTGATSADPSIDFDNSGNAFLCYVDYNVLSDLGAVFIRKSTNGGLSWGQPVEVINIDDDGVNKPADRPWMKIDRSSGATSGNIYITTMPPAVFGFIPPPYHPYFIRSTNGGNSFEPWKYLDATNWQAGSWIPQPAPFPTVSPDGKFHAVYPSLVFAQSADARYFMASTSDGGNSFTHSLIVAQDTSTVVRDQDAKKGYPLIADPSDADHLVFFSLLNIHGDADVFMWETFNGGQSWSNSIRINDDPISNNRMQDLIWADFDLDGDLIVTWRDRRNGMDGSYAADSEIWGAVRSADSTNFSANFRLSDTNAPFDSALTSGGNDFMSVKLVNDTIYSAWGDTRSGSVSIWFKKISIDGTIVSIKQVSSTEPIEVDIYPNPSISSITINGDELLKVVALNEKGEVVSSQESLMTSNEISISLSHLPDGIYYLQITSRKGSITNKVVKQE